MLTKTECFEVEVKSVNYLQFSNQFLVRSTKFKLNNSLDKLKQKYFVESSLVSILK